jgi:two-component sensor histidine kinase
VRNTNLLGLRTPSRLELSYIQTASDLSRMIAAGHFPHPGPRSDHADSPRVGDGFVRLDPAGRVSYASPNALSAYRRLGHQGDLTGLVLADLTRQLLPLRRRLDEETLSAVLGGRASRDAEVGSDTVTLIVRSIPLRPDGERVGAALLVRDVSDLRRRDRELVSKDVTIREIHHRVKNNLQTVAALLRLQARRTTAPDARTALEEAVRRVGSIAIVHETLSQVVEEMLEFDEVVDRLCAMVSDVSGVEVPVRIERSGSFGALAAEAATPLAMVVTEILQNAHEHGYPVGAPAPVSGEGRIRVTAHRSAATLVVRVEDDGVGLPTSFVLGESTQLGLSIVQTLVESELGGRFEIGPRDQGPGASVRLVVPVE